MVSRRARKLSRFKGETSGNVAITFAIAAVPMLLLMAAAIDYTRAITKRTALQQAADATSLAIAHDLSQNLSDAAVSTDANRYFAAAVGDARAWLDGAPTISADRGQVCLVARNRVPTMLMPVAAGAGFTPMADVMVAASSCARIDTTRFEVALALDNSGSMNESTSGTTKMASLQTAARQLVGIMDPPGAIAPRTAFSVVPFSSAVNVGASRAGAAWLDNAGASSIHWQNFQLPAARNNVWAPASKFDLFNELGIGWGGCVEERPAPYTSTDTIADPARPDTLFVPYLWPDEGTSALPAFRGLRAMNTYLPGKTGGACSTAAQPNAGVYAAADAPGNSVAVTNRVDNDLRADGQTMVCKYRGQGVVANPTPFSDVSGARMRASPNLLCSSRALTTLTNDTDAVTGALDAMASNGDTNLVGGFMWAWRTLSPRGPFVNQPARAVGPRNPVPYTTASTAKIVILMTDGFNHWTNDGNAINGSVYSSFGYYRNGRLGPTSGSNYRALMDDATLQACNNAKAAGVTVYTIGFTIPSNPIDNQGLDLLRSCASDATRAYVAQDGTALISTFRTIANQLAGLRLSH